MGFKARQKQRYGPVIKAADMKRRFFDGKRVWRWRCGFGWSHPCTWEAWKFSAVDQWNSLEEWQEVLDG